MYTCGPTRHEARKKLRVLERESLLVPTFFRNSFLIPGYPDRIATWERNPLGGGPRRDSRSSVGMMRGKNCVLGRRLGSTRGEQTAIADSRLDDERSFRS